MESKQTKSIKNGGGRKDVGVVDSYASKAGGRRSVAVSERKALDSVSNVSVSDVESESSSCSVFLEQLSPYWRERLESYGKRRHEENVVSETVSSDDEATPANSVVLSAKRGRGRPPTTGAYVGKAKAQAELNALRREEERQRFEAKVAAKVARNEATRVVAPPVLPEVENSLASELVKQVADASQVIVDVAAKSGNLKGTFAKALKVSAASIKAAVEELSRRSATAETVMLKADNARLRSEMAELRKEFSEFKSKMADKEDHPSQKTPSQPVSSTHKDSNRQQEELTRTILLQVGSMVNARFESFEERLLPEKRSRPPLAADKRGQTAFASEEAIPTPAPAPEKDQEASQLPKGKGGKNSKKAGAATEAAEPSQRKAQDGASTSQPTKEGWTTVTRGAKKKPAGKPAGKTAPTAEKAPKAAGTAKKARRKLRPPKTAAVVITLQPGAEEKGATYASVLTVAKNRIDLGSCGINSLRFRKAATGARILEVAAGETSGEKADTLAQKLREVLGDDLARVSRPIKCAEFRVTGLDDSVSKEDVASAIAQRGGCLIDAVKVGEVKRTYQGTGVTLVSCPVAAAKKLSEEGRLLVGWVSARVELVQPRPLRCYRCLEDGHVRAQCSAEIDRSGECYRCGEIGHKSSECSATPKCSICAAAKKPSEHRLGSKSCAPPKSRRSRTERTKASSEEAAPGRPPAQTGDEMAQMDAD